MNQDITAVQDQIKIQTWLLVNFKVNLFFQKVPGRCHPDFVDPRDPLHAKPHAEMVKWIEEHIKFESKKK